MQTDMVDSQFISLEEPAGAFVIDVALPADVIVNSVLARLAKLTTPSHKRR